MTSRPTPKHGWNAVPTQPGPARAPEGALRQAAPRIEPAAGEAVPAQRAPVQSKKTLVGLPAASFFGQLPGGPAPAPARPAPQPSAAREREPTQEVSLADMSLSSLGVSSEPDNAAAPFADSTQDVSLHELSLAARRVEGGAPEFGAPAQPLAAPLGMHAEARTSNPGLPAGELPLAMQQTVRPGTRRWWPVAAALPLLLGAGWFALDRAPADEPKASPAAAAAAATPAAAAPAAPEAVPAPSGALESHAAKSAQAGDPVPEQVAPAQPADGAALAAGKRADTLVAQASTLRKRRKLGPARGKYQAALALVPGHVGALRGLVQIALQQRDGNQAVLRARELVQASPDELGDLVLLGDAYKLARKPKEAREAWQTAARGGNALARKRLK